MKWGELYRKYSGGGGGGNDTGFVMMNVMITGDSNGEKRALRNDVQVSEVVSWHR